MFGSPVYPGGLSCRDSWHKVNAACYISATVAENQGDGEIRVVQRSLGIAFILKSSTDGTKQSPPLTAEQFNKVSVRTDSYKSLAEVSTLTHSSVISSKNDFVWSVVEGQNLVVSWIDVWLWRPTRLGELSDPFRIMTHKLLHLPASLFVVNTPTEVWAVFVIATNSPAIESIVAALHSSDFYWHKMGNYAYGIVKGNLLQPFAWSNVLLLTGSPVVWLSCKPNMSDYPHSL